MSSWSHTTSTDVSLTDLNINPSGCGRSGGMETEQLLPLIAKPHKLALGRLWYTCGHPRAHRNTPLVAQNSVDIDHVLDAWFKLFDSGSSFVSWHSELLEKTARTGGHVRHKVLCHQHLVLPGQVHCVTGDLANSKILWRRHWKKQKNFAEGVFLDRFSCPQSHSIHPTELMQTPEPHLAVVWTTARRVRTKCTQWQYTNQKLLYSRKYFFSRWVGSEIGE